MNNLVQMFSGWREVCGAQARVEGGTATYVIIRICTHICLYIHSHCRKECEGVARGNYHRGAEFNRVTAAGKKLFLSLLVRARRALHGLPGGRGANSLWLGWELSFSMLRAFRRHLLRWTASMVGSGEPVMRWAVFTTLWSVLRFATEQLPNQTEMQLVRMLSMVQR